MSQHHNTPADEIAPQPDNSEIDAIVDLQKFDDTEAGVTGLRSSGGYIDDEQLEALRGCKGIKVFRQMADNDPVIGAFLFAIECLVRQVVWTMQPADDSEQALEVAELVDSMLFKDMQHSWDDFLTEVLTMLWAGFAPMEVVTKRRRGYTNDEETNSRFDDGKVGIRKIALRAQESIERWDLDEKENVLGLWQQPDTGPQVYIPRTRFMLFRTKSIKNNPQGRSILRNAYRPWFFKTRMEEIEGIGVERDLAGLPVVRVPGSLFAANATVEEKKTLAAYKKMVTNIKRDKQEGVVLPSTRSGENGEYAYTLELLNTGSSRQFDTDKIINRYDRRIAMTVLADFLFLGESSGSWALSSDKTKLFANAISAIMKRIAEPFNETKGLIPEMVRINGYNAKLTPTLMHGDIENIDIGMIAEVLSKLASTGATIFPDRELENELRQRMGLPMAAEEETPGETTQTDDKLFKDKQKQGKTKPAKPTVEVD